MASRFIPVELFRGHWKALSDYREKTPVPDKLARFLMVAIPVASSVGILLLHGKLAAPGSLLAGVALLAGGFLAAFGQIASLRLRLSDRARNFGDAEATDRDALDETAAHLLVASILSAVVAFLLVLSMNFGSNDEGQVEGIWAAIVVAPATYVFLVFVVAVPRLYSAYASMNAVRDELSGTHRGKGSKGS